MLSLIFNLPIQERFDWLHGITEIPLNNLLH